MEQEHRPTAAVVLYMNRNAVDLQHFQPAITNFVDLNSTFEFILDDRDLLVAVGIFAEWQCNSCQGSIACVRFWPDLGASAKSGSD